MSVYDTRVHINLSSTSKSSVWHRRNITLGIIYAMNTDNLKSRKYSMVDVYGI